jgi:hypothetical protein
MPGIAFISIISSLFSHPHFHLLEMCIQHQIPIKQEFRFEIPARIPFARTNSFVADGVFGMNVCIVALPWLVKGVMNVLEELLVLMSD